jgi:hypothetical protein
MKADTVVRVEMLGDMAREGGACLRGISDALNGLPVRASLQQVWDRLRHSEREDAMTFVAKVDHGIDEDSCPVCSARTSKEVPQPIIDAVERYTRSEGEQS